MPQSVAATRAGVVNCGALIDSFDFRQHKERGSGGGGQQRGGGQVKRQALFGQVQVIKANKNNKHNFPVCARGAATSRIAPHLVANCKQRGVYAML